MRYKGLVTIAPNKVASYRSDPDVERDALPSNVGQFMMTPPRAMDRMRVAIADEELERARQASLDGAPARQLRLGIGRRLWGSPSRRRSASPALRGVRHSGVAQDTNRFRARPPPEYQRFFEEGSDFSPPRGASHASPIASDEESRRSVGASPISAGSRHGDEGDESGHERDENEVGTLRGEVQECRDELQTQKLRILDMGVRMVTMELTLSEQRVQLTRQAATIAEMSEVLMQLWTARAA